MRYQNLFIAVVVVAMATLSCSSAKDEITQRALGDPIPAGMATIAAAGSGAAVTGLTNMINQGANTQALRQQRPAVGAFPEPGTNPEDCADSGTMTFTNQSGGFTVVFSNCKDGPYTANATVVVTNMTTQDCTEDNTLHTDYVPTAFLATVTNGGYVDVEGLRVTMTNFAIELTPQGTNPPTYSEGNGGNCSLQSANLHATGKLSETISGAGTVTMNLGSNSLDVNYENLGTKSGFSIEGNVNFGGLCFGSNGTPITIETTTQIVIPDGTSTPESGVLLVNSGLPSQTTVDYSQSPDGIPCDGLT